MPYQNIVKKVKPGLSGIGSIIFRGEEDILHGEAGTLDSYEKVIAPYKGALEEWFVRHQGLATYFLAIAVTIWTVLFPETTLVWKVFKNLPIPPQDLKKILGYKSFADQNQ